MKYCLHKVAEFTEIFDTENKITVYVSESRRRAKKVMIKLNKGTLQPEDLK